jgi:long-chain fatty acid transport protein
MRSRGGFVGKALGYVVLGGLCALPMHAAGFGIFEQGAKAMGMAGAFTAQADDPSLLFYNAGGLAFVDKTGVAVGATYIKGTKATFQGAAPFPGPGVNVDQKGLSEFPPHIYWVQPISTTWKFGLGIDTPFGLTTEWKNPDQFAGRFFSTKAALRAFDINPTLGWQITPTFGIGVGAVARVSDVELHRNLGAVNPFTQHVADVGRLTLDSDFEKGYGFNVGILHKLNESFSWGLSYRSKIKVDYKGRARVDQISTGNAQFDAAVRALIPFDRDLPVDTSIEFPDMASLGFAFGLTRDLLLETDANWTGWKSFDELPITFTGGAGNSLPSSTVPQRWKDVYNYRAGLRWTLGSGNQLRFGYVYDQTPQPEETVSPLLPDSNRSGITLGYGSGGPGLGYDLAIMYLNFDKRTRAKSFAGESDFFGTYNTEAWLFGATLHW